MMTNNIVPNKVIRDYTRVHYCFPEGKEARVTGGFKYLLVTIFTSKQNYHYLKKTKTLKRVSE